MRIIGNKFISRATRSRRGEPFNPLIWPFLFSTLAYGFGFLLLAQTDAVLKSSLWVTMTGLWTPLPYIWGGVCVLTIILGLTFLMFKIPPIGRTSGLVGFMTWLFAAFCWLFNDGWITLLAIAIPNMYFWLWQYLSLSNFRREDAEDDAFMEHYRAGDYDQEPDGKARRESNRGMDLQSDGSYDNPDDGGDLSRPVQ